MNLTDGEIQSLLKLLITKQSEHHTEWVQHGKNKAADPATVAKLLIEEKERELFEEKELNKSLLEQLKELKNLLVLEKNTIKEAEEIKRRSAERVVAAEQELRVTSNRLKLVDEKHAAEVLQWSRKVEELEGLRVAAVHALEEENRRMVQRYEQQISHRNETLEAETSRELESMRMERDSVSVELENARLKIQDLQEELKARVKIEVELNDVSTNLNRVNDEKRILDEELNQLRHNLGEKERQLFEKDGLIRHLESEASNKEGKLNESSNLTQFLESRVDELSREADEYRRRLENAEHSHSLVEQLQNEKEGLQKNTVQFEQKVEEIRQKEQEAWSRVDAARGEGYEDAKVRIISWFGCFLCVTIIFSIIEAL